jgi:TonB-dependent receptor
MRTMYKASLRRKMITSISATVMAALTATATAQEAEEVTDEVVVTGIRQALESSLDVKRNAKGIVDSISAEDMGKFPDSNLAESLQRITGVSIDRDQTSGEGKTVTVRGFGADYNLVTLNGRSMPTSTLGNFAGAPSSRSYDFGNLAPEAVSRVDIYKTSKGSIASGGMGSTIDIRTTRPLDMPGFNASIGMKSIDDESHDGSENKEVSAILYNTWFDDRIGVALTAIRSDLSHTVGSFRHQWSAFEAFGDHSTPGNDEEEISAHFDNTPYSAGSYGDMVNNQGGLNGQGLPDDTLMSVLNGNTGYHIDELEQERNNYQLTFQARPLDGLTVTLDTTKSELEHEVTSNSIGISYLDSPTSRFGLVTTFGPGNPATPLTLEFLNPIGGYDDGCTYDGGLGRCLEGIDGVSNTVGYQNNVTEVESTGINIEWDVNERLSLAFDFHDSSSESSPMSPYGSNAYIGSDSLAHQFTQIDYTTEIPVITLGNYNGGLAGIGGDNPISPSTRFLTGAGNVRSLMVNDIEQARVNGSYDLSGSDLSSFADVVKFGLSKTENSVRMAFGENQAPNWNGVIVNNFDGWPHFAGDTAVELFDNVVPLQPFFSGLEGADQIFGSIIMPSYDQWFGAYQMATNLQMNKHYADNDKYKPALICGTNTVAGCASIPYTTDRTIKEETSALYAEFSKDLNLFDRDASVVFGLRYENTDVTSLNLVTEYGSMTTNGDKTNAIPSGGSIVSSTEGGYNYLLPSVDFDIDLLDDVKLRASYSQTIARQTYDELAGGQTINPLLGNVKQTPGGFTGGGNEGNPNLKPFESDNYDVSAEWYYGDVSYLSVGYFAKEASNWVGTANKYIPVQGLIHPTFNEEAIFNIAYPSVSDRTETIDGFELAIQHDFSDYNPFPLDLTGFGFIVNATFVDSDASYDDAVANSEADNQFAVIGISDSRNVIAYYERFGLSARVAYNWRDRYLNFSGSSSGYTGQFEQVDANLTYAIPGTNLAISYDGINLNEAGRETFERNNPAYKTWVSAGHAKHMVGLRWKY